MESKTPKTDAILDALFAALVPHTRTCEWKGTHEYCEGEFEIVAEDISFLKMLRVVPPNFCPTCRRMRRLVNMNMIRLFKRPCNAPEHAENMISILPEECPFPVYDYVYFTSDEFDAFSFGIPYTPNITPLQTLFSLRKKFPMPSFLNRDPGSINSDYSNGGRNNKNCYYTMGCYDAEDVWYSNLAFKSRQVMDSRSVNNSEFVYSSLFSDHLYKTSFVYFSSNVSDSIFLFDCKNCTNCFGCVNLRNKKYCVFNEQYSKEDYEAFIASISPLSIDTLSTCKEKFWELVKQHPMNASHNIGSTNVAGTGITNSRNAFDVVDAIDSEHIRHVDGALAHKDSMDFLFSGGNSSKLYGTVNVGSQSSDVRFSISCKFCTNSEFIFNSKNLDNCFMCFGLQNKSYCILNAQYEPEEYFKLVDEIKSTMIKNGEYDGLGLEFSAQAYNFSMAQISYPLSDATIVKLGGYIAKEPETNVGNTPVLAGATVPQTILQVDDAILEHAIACTVTGRPFRIVKSELEFLQRMNLPLPTTHPAVRMEGQFRLSPNGKKYEATCAKCKKDIYSMFNPEENFILYCEQCYKQEVV